jgi:hydroxyacylglutathione hydrolase
MNRRTLAILAGVGVTLLLLLMVGGGLVASILSRMPASQGPRLALSDDVVGIDTGGSYAWIVRTPNGAALVDAGIDPQAAALLAELEAMGLTLDDVHTVLLTHAHGDHTGGLAALPHVTLVHGPGEGPLLRGEGAELGVLPGIFSAFTGPPPLPATVVEAVDDQVVDVDGSRVRVLSTPGHTAGSTSFVWDGVLFAGDALFAAEDGVMLPPAFLNTDTAMAARSVERFGPLDPVWMADGHAGITPDADQAIDAWLAREGPTGSQP